MTVRSRPLFVGQALGNGSMLDLFTCRADRTCIIKQLSIDNPGAGALAVQLQVVTSIGTGRIFVVNAPANSANPQITWYVVLAPGDKVQGQAAGPNVKSSGFGVLLLGAPA